MPWTCPECSQTQKAVPKGKKCGFCDVKITYCSSCLANKQCEICSLHFCNQHINACAMCSKFCCSRDTKRIPHDTSNYCTDCVQKKLLTIEPDDSKWVVGCPLLPSKKPDLSVLKDFNIELMTYKEGQARQKNKDPALKGKQLEHGIPNSSFMQNPGRKGTPVFGADNYTEGDALVFPVDDDQSQGTEHKFLTNRERQIDKELEKEGAYATVDQKIRLMTPVWEDALLKFRTYTGKRKREVAASEAAQALAYEFKEHLTKALKIDPKARTKNGLGGRKAKPPAKKLKKNQEFKGI